MLHSPLYYCTVNMPACKFCHKFYTRDHFLVAHEEKCPKKDILSDVEEEDEDEEMVDESTQDQENSGDEAHEEDGDDDDDDGESESDGEEGEEESYDPWSYLKTKMNSKDDETEQLSEIYKEHMLFFHEMRKDPTHQKIQGTLKRLRDEEEMDWDEALDYAVKKRRFLFDQIVHE